MPYYPRASSGMLRSRIRPATATAAAAASGHAPPLRAAGACASPPSVAMQQVRTEIRGREDLGGPGGQQPPPPNPGGPEAVKRNWAPIGGAALAAAAALAYMTRGPEKIQQSELPSATTTEIGGLPSPAGRDAIKERVNGAESKALQEMSGRKDVESGRKDGMGGFRSE